MENKVAPLRELLRSSISDFRDKAYIGEADKRDFTHHEVPPYRTISNPKEGKLEQIH